MAGLRPPTGSVHLHPNEAGSCISATTWGARAERGALGGNILCRYMKAWIFTWSRTRVLVTLGVGLTVTAVALALGILLRTPWVPPVVRFGQGVRGNIYVTSLRSWAMLQIQSDQPRGMRLAIPLPAVVQAIPAPYLPWQVGLDRDRPALRLISVGSFYTFDLFIGAVSLDEPTNNHCYKIADGIYAHNY